MVLDPWAKQQGAVGGLYLLAPRQKEIPFSEAGLATQAFFFSVYFMSKGTNT